MVHMRVGGHHNQFIVAKIPHARQLISGKYRLGKCQVVLDIHAKLRSLELVGRRSERLRRA